MPVIVLGDISGIQNYLFDLAEDGGGQAQRLRARSFFVQILAEGAALRVLRALNWRLNSILLSGAGKFVLQGPDQPQAEGRLSGEQQTINEWLLRETRAELRLTLAWAGSGESDATAYRNAQDELQRKKARPWAPEQGNRWNPSQFLLAPLGQPCDLCRHAPASQPETDRETGQVRQVCRVCAQNREIGRRLPRAHWLVIDDRAHGANLELFGLGVRLTNETPVLGETFLAVANLQAPASCPAWCPPDRFLRRRLVAHVPADGDGQPVWFTDLAKEARGDRLLAVLKADADSLGVRFQHLLNTGGLDAIRALSEQLDAFFAGRLRQELSNPGGGRRRWIYTIFAGGDDLIMVGPWDVMVDFAGQLRQWFADEFREHGLTLSAGLALMKPKRPIKPAVAEAERLLEQAKDEGKDRLAAFGQVWKWQHHDDILKTARQLVEWVDRQDMERGWLHTLLELAEARHGPTPDPLATSRLAYHVDRNYRRSPAGPWARRLVERFDDLDHSDIRYLPAMVRYALTATRAPGEE